MRAGRVAQIGAALPRGLGDPSAPARGVGSAGPRGARPDQGAHPRIGAVRGPHRGPGRATSRHLRGRVRRTVRRRTGLCPGAHGPSPRPLPPASARQPRLRRAATPPKAGTGRTRSVAEPSRRWHGRPRRAISPARMPNGCTRRSAVSPSPTATATPHTMRSIHVSPWTSGSLLPWLTWSSRRRGLVMPEPAQGPMSRSPPGIRRAASRPRSTSPIPIDSLAGLSDLPGVINGFGAIPAEDARRLAAGDSRWRHVLTCQATGAVLDVGTLSYRPPAAVGQACSAARRDLQVPRMRGPGPGVRPGPPHPVPTRADVGGNLNALCRRHHRLKHDGGWRVEAEPGSALRWTSPQGGRDHDVPRRHPRARRLIARLGPCRPPGARHAVASS